MRISGKHNTVKICALPIWEEELEVEGGKLLRFCSTLSAPDDELEAQDCCWTDLLMLLDVELLLSLATGCCIGVVFWKAWGISR